MFLEVSQCAPRALASHVPWQAKGRKTTPESFIPLSPLSGSEQGHSPPNSSPQQSDTSSEDTNNISKVNLKKEYIYILYI